MAMNVGGVSAQRVRDLFQCICRYLPFKAGENFKNACQENM
jgi:hypothetical protein